MDLIEQIVERMDVSKMGEACTEGVSEKTKREWKEHKLAYKFRLMYANLPLPIRKQEIVCIVDGEPMTFHAVYTALEAKDFSIANRALDQLVKIGVLE